MYSHKRLFLDVELTEAFNFFDMDHNGYLDREELLELLIGCENEEMEYLLEQLDSNGDLQVSLA